MNKTEAEFARYLEAQKQAGEILSYQFESITLKLANDTRYTPDFVVINKDLTITLYEVKGFWRDDARVKYQVAAEKFPYFRFTVVYKQSKKAGGGWDIHEIRR